MRLGRLALERKALQLWAPAPPTQLEPQWRPGGAMTLKADLLDALGTSTAELVNSDQH